jgi:mitochondrial fission protein ELM1
LRHKFCDPAADIDANYRIPYRLVQVYLNMSLKRVVQVVVAKHSAPRVWLLLDGKPGHASQVTGLARQMEWQAQSIQVTFNALNFLPNPVLGASLLSVEAESRAQLQSPFPDVVVSMGRKTMPVAAWIKKQTGGHCKIIMIGRKAIGDPRHLDLLISCAHFQQLPRPGLFELTVPPTKVDAAELDRLRTVVPDPFVAPAGPRIAVLIGGPTTQHSFDAAFAQELAVRLTRAAKAIDGRLAFLTSRRTPPDVIHALQNNAPSAQFYLWEKAQQPNLYMNFLSHCDALVVTGESETMIAEAVATGKPLSIYPLKEKQPAFKWRFINWLFAMAKGHGVGARFVRGMFMRGWIVPTRDLNIMHQALCRTGQAIVFDKKINTLRPAQNRELARLKETITVLVSTRPT